VVIDVDRARNRVRATASGATALVEGANVALAAAGDDERRAAGARALLADAGTERVVARTPDFVVVDARESIAVVDARAVVRLVAPRGVAREATAGTLAVQLARLLDETTTYGDVGRALPDVWLLAGARTVEFSGLADADDIATLATEDIAGMAGDTPLALIAIPKRA
jgi:hypothetical protein